MEIAFHFDFLSPYSYLAWTQIRQLARRNGATVRPVPTLLAPLLAHGQTRGPAEIPAKRRYLVVDLTRSTRRLGVPFGPPPAHPFNPLLPLRAACMLEGDERERLIDALYAQTWAGGGIGCDTVEKVEAAAARAGLDPTLVVAGASSHEAKARLHENTDGAIARGVFGVPTMLTGPGPADMFFGFDAFDALERHLRGEELARDDDLRAWADLPQTVSRI